MPKVTAKAVFWVENPQKSLQNQVCLGGKFSEVSAKAVFLDEKLKKSATVV